MRRAEPNRREPRPCPSPAPIARLALVALLLLMPSAAVVQAQIDIPGPELFAKPPETPLELWDAVDYLVRVGQPDRAVPYLNAFLQSNPSDEVLLQVKDRYGSGSILRLEDDPATQPFAGPLLDRLNDASRRLATNPARMRRFVGALTRTEPEQAYGLEQLRHAGPYAVPPILDALSSPALSASDRALLANNLGRLDATAVPPLLAALDAPDERLAADVAAALGRIGDPRAVPFLTYPATRNERLVVRDPARGAISLLTGQPFDTQPKPPARVLTDEAYKYLTHAIEFPGTGDQTEIWMWDQAGGLTSRVVPRNEAEGYFGLKLAEQALALAPGDRPAQVLTTALALQKAAERSGVAGFTRDPSGAYATALAAGPAVLGDVLRLALVEGLPRLSAAAATTLGRVADRDSLSPVQGGLHPLVAALNSPDHRTRFAAAQALVQLDPRNAFPGSSRVVPVLAQFVTVRQTPRAVVIDGDANRATQVASVLRGLGYETSTASTGKEGFRLAAGSADVELILLRPAILDGAWSTLDTLSNLRADPSTAGVPIVLYGPLQMRSMVRTALESHPNILFTVEPTDPGNYGPILERDLVAIGARPLSAEERRGYAEVAAALLAGIALRPGSPFEPGIAGIEPALAEALLNPVTASASAIALGDVPDVSAQRQLADVVLNTAGPLEQRLRAAEALTRSIQRFGPLLLSPQERGLLRAHDAEPDPALRTALAGILGALRPGPDVVSPRLRAFAPDRVLSAPSP